MLINKLRTNWANYLVLFPFEWWVTVTFRDLANGKPAKSEHAKVKLRAWIRKIIKEEKLQIAYFAVVNEVNRIHLHLLVLGRNRHGKTLLDVPIKRWQNAWKAYSKIEAIYDTDGLSHYFERNTVLKDNTLSEVVLFNLELLKKVKISNNLIKLDGERAWDFSKNLYVPHVDKKSVQSQMIELVDGFK